jgi:hypothetical protein
LHIDHAIEHEVDTSAGIFDRQPQLVLCDWMQSTSVIIAVFMKGYHKRNN